MNPDLSESHSPNHYFTVYIVQSYNLNLILHLLSKLIQRYVSVFISMSHLIKYHSQKDFLTWPLGSIYLSQQAHTAPTSTVPEAYNLPTYLGIFFPFSLIHEFKRSMTVFLGILNLCLYPTFDQAALSLCLLESWWVQLLVGFILYFKPLALQRLNEPQAAHLTDQRRATELGLHNYEKCKMTVLVLSLSTGDTSAGQVHLQSERINFPHVFKHVSLPDHAFIIYCH